MTEKQNTSNISTLRTNIDDPTGIKSIANGVTNNLVAREIIQKYSEKPNNHTRTIRSTIESLLNCQINERVNNSYTFFRWDMPCISEVADALVAIDNCRCYDSLGRTSINTCGTRTTMICCWTIRFQF